MFGETREYLTIKILHNDMTVMVPTENAALAGLRRVIDEETVEKVLNVLRDDVSEMPKNWNRRFKHNRDKIKTGDIYELAEVVRNLSLRESEKGLSTGEKQMYTRAKKILASELMYALDKDEDEAETYLDELLANSATSQMAGAAADTADRAFARGSDRRMASAACARVSHFSHGRRSDRGRRLGERLGAGARRRLSSSPGARCCTGVSTPCAQSEAIEQIVVALPAGVEAPAGMKRGGGRVRCARSLCAWRSRRRPALADTGARPRRGAARS